MLHGLIEWWMDLAWWIRGTLALILLGISTVLYLNGTLWPWGWGVGGIMLAFSIPSREEQN